MFITAQRRPQAIELSFEEYWQTGAGKGIQANMVRRRRGAKAERLWTPRLRALEVAWFEAVRIAGL